MTPRRVLWGLLAIATIPAVVLVAAVLGVAVRIFIAAAGL